MKANLSEKIEDLLLELNGIVNPSIISFKISIFLTDSLRENQISFYEAYLINGEILKHRRNGYLKPAWNGNVGISTCIAILNQILVAKIFNDSESVIANLKNLGIEAYRLIRTKRDHYILDKFYDFLDSSDSPKLLKLLLDVREDYENLADDLGPFHNEQFPFHFYSPERILLDGTKTKFDKIISSNIENLIIELNMI